MGQFTEKDSKNLSILLKKMSSDPKYKDFKRTLLNKSELAAQASGDQLDVSNKDSIARNLATNAALMVADALNSRPKFAGSIGRLLADAKNIDGYNLDTHISDAWNHPQMSTESVLVTAMHLFESSNDKDKEIYSGFIDEVMATSGRNRHKTPSGFALAHGEMNFISSYINWDGSRNNDIEFQTTNRAKSNKANMAAYSNPSPERYTPSQSTLPSYSENISNSQLAATLGLVAFTAAGIYYATRKRSSHKEVTEKKEQSAKIEKTETKATPRKNNAEKNRKRKQRKLRARERSRIEDSTQGEIEVETNAGNNQPENQVATTQTNQEPPKEITITKEPEPNKKGLGKNDAETESQATALTASESQTYGQNSPFSRQPEPKELPPLARLDDIKEAHASNTQKTLKSEISAVSDAKSTEELLKQVEEANERARKAEEKNQELRTVNERAKKAEEKNKALEDEKKVLEAHSQILESKTSRLKKQLRTAKSKGHDEGFKAGIQVNKSEARRAKNWAAYESERASIAEQSAFYANHMAATESHRAFAAEQTVSYLQQQNQHQFNDGFAAGFLEPQFNAYRQGVEDAKRMETQTEASNENRNSPLPSSHASRVGERGTSPQDVAKKINRSLSF